MGTYGTIVLLHIMSPPLGPNLTIYLLFLQQQQTECHESKVRKLLQYSLAVVLNVTFITVNVVLFQIKSLEKELEEHQAYKPRGHKAKHGQLQVCANTKHKTSKMIYHRGGRAFCHGTQIMDNSRICHSCSMSMVSKIHAPISPVKELYTRLDIMS